MATWTLLHCDARLTDGPAPRICPAQFQTTRSGPDAFTEAATYGWTRTTDGLRCADHGGHINPEREATE